MSDQKEEQTQTMCVPPCQPLLQMRLDVAALHEDVRALTSTLLGDRKNPESMRKSVYGTVERWGNWMDAGVGFAKVVGWVVPILAALVGGAKAAGWL